MAQRDELIMVELVHVRETLDKLEIKLSAVISDVGTVRLSDIASIRAELAELKSDTKILQYQSRKSGAWGGMFAGAGVSALVAALAQLLFHAR